MEVATTLNQDQRTSSKTRSPNLLILGAQKCGTHWLHANLRRHPEAYMSEEKEPHFFNNLDRHTPAGFTAYLSEHFAPARSEAVVGEASTGYFRTRQGTARWADPKRLVDTPSVVLRYLGPEVRLVVGIRQPVERAISAYLHHWGKGRLLDGRSLIDLAPDFGVVDIGLYHRHLSRWSESFARDRLHVVMLEDIHQQPHETFGALCRFLEIQEIAPREGVIYKGFDLEWRGDYLELTEAGLTEIRSKIRAGKLGPEVERHLPRISHGELIELQQHFDEDIGRLESWLGRDLSHWRGDPWQRFVRYGRK